MPKKPSARKARTKSSMPVKAKIDVSTLPKESDPTLRLIWVDRMELSVRADTPVATMRYYSVLLDHLSEACRLQMSTVHLRSMVDVMCRSLDYYPDKPKK